MAQTVGGSAGGSAGSGGGPGSVPGNNGSAADDDFNIIVIPGGSGGSPNGNPGGNDFGGNGGGGGGQGGANGRSLAGGTHEISDTVTGGNGGAGGRGDEFGGGGGAGGYGIVFNGTGSITVTTTGHVAGGNGGSGGKGGFQYGFAGGGGGGIFVTGNGSNTVTITNDGFIGAGNGGAPGDAIRGANLVVTNSGQIQGVPGSLSFNEDGDPIFIPGGDSVVFTGGENLFEFQGGTVTGNVVANGTNDLFRLGGSAGGTFDVSNIGSSAQYRGFENFHVSGGWTLTGTNANTQMWSASAGTVAVNGAMENTSFTITIGGTLSGTGTVGAINVLAGGTLAPGNSPGVLNTGNVTLNAGATHAVELGGTAAGQFDQLNVTGTVSLGGASFNLTLVNAFNPVPGDSFTIILNDGNDPVDGTFAGLADEAVFSAGGEIFVIDYNGGDGNDVVVKVISPITVDLNNAAGTGSTTWTEGTPVSLFQSAQVTPLGNEVTSFKVAIAGATPTMSLSVSNDIQVQLQISGFQANVAYAGGELTVTAPFMTAGFARFILNNLIFNDTSDNPSASPLTLTVTIDGATDSHQLNITPVNDAPSLTGDRSATINEGGTYVLTAADLGFSDPDDNAAGVTFTVSNLASGTLLVNNAAATQFTGTELANGEVSFIHNGSETTTASFNVSVEDGNEDNSASAASPFSFTVTPVNDAPSLTGDLSASVNEGGTYVFTAADLGFADPDDAAAGVTFAVSNLANGTLLVSNAPATQFSGTQLANGQVSFVHDGSETTAASLNVSVEDGNEDNSVPVASPFAFTITPVNDAPSVTGLPSDVMVESAVASPVDLSGVTFADPDSGNTPVTVTIAASAGTLAATSGGSVTIGGSGTGALTLTGTVTDINTFLDTPANVTYVSIPGALGDDAATLTVSVNDNGNTGAGNALEASGSAINIDIQEQRSLIVTTLSDVVDAFDNQISLREAIAYANIKAGADTITFDAALSGVVRLTSGELSVTDAVTVDGGGHIVISGDAAANDVISAVLANISDVAATLGAGTAGDNVRIFNSSTDLTVKNITLTGGMPDGQGGAISSGGNVTVLNSTIMGNAANASNGQASGGAIMTFFDVTVTDSTISGNFSGAGAPSSGAGIVAGNATITNSTLSNNIASYEAGGLFAFGNVTLVNATVTGNSASTGGGILAHGLVNASNSIILGNSGFQGAEFKVYSGNGTPTYSGLNIVGTGNDSDASDGVINADPALVFAQTAANGAAAAGVLANNGGPVQTIALALTATNPALDASNSSTPPSDARGQIAQDIPGVGSNGANFRDLGAFEAVDPTSVAATPVRTGIAEDASTAIAIKFADLTIVDPFNQLTFELGGADGGLFEIGSDGIYLKQSTALDHETNHTLDVTLTVKRDGSAIATVPAQFLVTDVNEAPTAVSFSGTVKSLAENTPTATRTKIADITVTDDALGTNSLGLTGADSSFFEIDGGVLYLKAGVVLDFEDKTSYAVAVTVDDTALPGIELTSGPIMLSISDVNEAPSVTSGATGSVAENTAASTVVYTAAAFDPDTGDSIAWSLTGADANLLAIGADGAVRLLASANFETKSSYSFNVLATDSGNLTATKAVTVSVTDLNEAPTALVFSNVRTAIAENASTAARLKIADIIITDDALGTETITLAGADASLFEIFGGDLYLKAGAKLDFESNPRLDVTVNVNDATVGGAIDVFKALRVAVTDVEETIRGTNGNNRLTGGTGDDSILGLNGKDTMNGGAGKDVLQGGAGADRMTGGSDADTFVFTSTSDSAPGASGFINNNPVFNRASGAGARDVITDFTPGQDKISLSAIDANTKLAGNQAFKFLGTATFTSTPGSLVYRKFNETGTANDITIVYGDVNGDKLADFQIELSGLKTLTARDFIL